MDGLGALIEQIHPVDRQATQVWRAAPSTVRMFCGARFWPKVKRAIIATPPTGDLHADVLRIADAATRTIRVDRDQLVGITLAGLMLVESIGVEAFGRFPEELALPEAALLETPTMVLKRRARNAPEGLLGRFMGDRRRWRVTVEPDPDATYVVTHGAPLAPCRGGDHHQCLVGILAGADRLSPVDGDEPYPVIRRACEARVFGRVSIVTLFPAA
ncbi:MAG: hypothetical protein FJW21_11085 [Acidimicrobiia bacterium]|nr:hypothetical protein [Acidimicrobiia bacterium]